MVAERSCACVLITHEARFAAWADRIVRVRDGELVEDARLERSGRVAAVGSAAGTGTAS
jgi:ABC-type lipoprotein export system ATPase subunit